MSTAATSSPTDTSHSPRLVAGLASFPLARANQPEGGAGRRWGARRTAPGDLESPLIGSAVATALSGQ